MKKVFKWILLVLVVGFVVAQFFQVARTNPPFTATQTIDNIVNVPRGCSRHFDACLRRIATPIKPSGRGIRTWRQLRGLSSVMWIRGAGELIFPPGCGPGHEPQDSIDRLKAMCREVQSGGMPLTSYKMIHWSSWLSADDVKQICDWSTAEQKRLGGNASGN